ncbi:MerR family transcriptional regulator [Maritimibacter dapengensis]|uniref:MerR family transcriptional regulator n=1 Tax=Maritimibacter dapengensis TaxID=2836868 RepID=A0ABS6T3J2_9RHOB|nr:MerR family transcriptional regulator [Maritimibacter dapengensis]MBV7379278.1 MerR family transcriptional regulator [Maritimibacter dapengensis]
MSERIEDYTVGELARIAGVTVRMLHHYDEIGLLSPAWIAPNGYRYYGRAEAERLQEILALKAGGVPLAEIGAMLDDGDRLARLIAHRARLEREASKVAGMIETLDATIETERKGRIMATDKLYWPHAPERQAEHEAWLVDTYGNWMAEAIAASKAHLEKAPEGMEGKMDALRDIEAALVAAYEGGLAPEDADVTAHRDWVAGMWGRDCSPDAHAGLANMYLSHPEFVARYEALSPGFSQWLPAAIKAGAR